MHTVHTVQTVQTVQMMHEQPWRTISLLLFDTNAAPD